MAGSWKPRGSPTAPPSCAGRSPGRGSTRGWCSRQRMGGIGRRTRWPRPGRRCTWPIRWGCGGSATAGSKTMRKTPLTWPRLGRLPEAWIAPAEIRELRELTRYRIKLVRLRTSCKDQVHAVLAKLGIPVTCTDIFGVWGNTWLDGLELGQPYAGKVASLRTLAGELTAEITVLEAAIAD